jgi:hypothetical protein
MTRFRNRRRPLQDRRGDRGGLSPVGRRGPRVAESSRDEGAAIALASAAAIRRLVAAEGSSVLNDLRPLGRSPLRITAVGPGCWQFSERHGLAGGFWPALSPETTTRS